MARYFTCYELLDDTPLHRRGDLVYLLRYGIGDWILVVDDWNLQEWVSKLSLIPYEPPLVEGVDSSVGDSPISGAGLQSAGL